MHFEFLGCTHINPRSLWICVCVCLAEEEEEDVLALAGMRQTAVGQYLRGTRWVGGGGGMGRG